MAKQTSKPTMQAMDAYIKLGIETLRMSDPKNRKGILATATGFAVAFERKFGVPLFVFNKAKKESTGYIVEAFAEGRFEGHFCRGGPILYLPGEAPAGASVAKKGGDVFALLDAAAKSEKKLARA